MPGRTVTYLSTAEVAKRIGLGPRSLSRIKLPPPDVKIGPYKGWRADTIDEWQASRPGRGRHGARTL